MNFLKALLIIIVILFVNKNIAYAINFNFSPALLNLIKHQEGFLKSPGKDPSGLWTIGYGHVLSNRIDLSKKIDKSEATIIMIKDLIVIKHQVDSIIITNLDVNKLEALYALVYNIGIVSFKKSKLLYDINHNASLDNIYRDFLSFHYYNKHYSNVLYRRRSLEWSLWMRSSVKSPFFNMG